MAVTACRVMNCGRGRDGVLRGFFAACPLLRQTRERQLPEIAVWPVQRQGGVGDKEH